MRVGKIVITNAIKSLPNFLTLNHNDSDVGHFKNAACRFASQPDYCSLSFSRSDLKNFQFN
jgi:hypothetical protein